MGSIYLGFRGVEDSPRQDQSFVSEEEQWVSAGYGAQELSKENDLNLSVHPLPIVTATIALLLQLLQRGEDSNLQASRPPGPQHSLLWCPQLLYPLSQENQLPRLALKMWGSGQCPQARGNASD